MRVSTVAAWLLGLALLALLLAMNDGLAVLEAVASLRLWLVLVVAYHLVPLWVDGVAWQRLFADPPPLIDLLRIRFIAEGVNGLFPVPHLGELLRADLARRLARGAEAAAAVVVDVTLGVATEVLFAALGLALLGSLLSDGLLLRAVLMAMALLLGGAGAFYFLQRAGLFALAVALAHRWAPRSQSRLALEEAQALDGQVAALYARRRVLLISALWRLAGWIVGAGEIWLILRGLGQPIDFAGAFVLESLSQVARTGAFVIPGGLGVQDGALLLLCAQFGLGAETGLALALAKRCRELVLGLPALLAAYVILARRWTATGESRGAQPPA